MASIPIAEVRRELEELRARPGLTLADLEGFFQRYLGTQTPEQQSLAFVHSRDFAGLVPGTSAFEFHWKHFADDLRRFNQEVEQEQVEAAQTRRGWLSFFRKKNRQDRQALEQSQQAADRQAELNAQAAQANQEQIDAQEEAIRRQQQMVAAQRAAASRRGEDAYFLIPPLKRFDYDEAREKEQPSIDEFKREQAARDAARSPGERAREELRRETIRTLRSQANELQQQMERASEFERRKLKEQKDKLEDEIGDLIAQEQRNRSMLSRAFDRFRKRRQKGEQELGEEAKYEIQEPTAQPETGVPRAAILRAAARSAYDSTKSGLVRVGNALPQRPITGAIRLGAAGLGALGNALPKRPITRWSGLFFCAIYFATLYFPISYADGTMFWQIAILGMGLMLLFFLSERFRTDFGSFEGIFFFLFLAVHFFLMSQGFSAELKGAYMALGIVFVISLIYYIFAEHRNEKLTMLIVLILLSTLVYSLPYLSVKYLNDFSDVVAMLVRLTPVGAVFMLMQMRQSNPYGYADRLIIAYKLVFILILIGFLIGGMLKIGALLPNLGFGSVNLPDQDKNFWERRMDQYRGIMSKGTKLYQQTTDPQSYYSRQVERNKKKPLGVKIESLRPSAKLIDNESEMLVYGNVHATSFIGESVLVQPMCTLQGKTEPEASVDPQDLEVLFGGSQAFECTFDPKRLNPPQWKQGTYTVIATANFPFQTWSYITYSFIDKERWRNYARQGIDPNTALGIPQQATATYTSGPIEVGMGGSGRLIVINPDGKPIVEGGRIGVTVDSGWEKGRLQSVESFEIKVPEPFTLTDCDRGEPQSSDIDQTDPEYTNYVFDNPTFTDARTFSSITCKLTIPEDQAAAARDLVSKGDKVDRSFIAVVKYKYTVEERTTITVR